MTRRRAGLAASLLVLAACGGSSGDSVEDTSTEPAITSATLPTPTAAPDPGSPAPTDAETIPTTTIMLVPSPDADLPTQAPHDAATAPVTTVPGPLPEPAVQLIERSSFAQPLDLAGRARDSRLFIVEQGGRIYGSDDEEDTVVFDIADVVATGAATFGAPGGERGLLGLAFDPDANVAYVNFTNGDGNTVVAELVVDAVTGVFDPTTYREVLTIEQPFSNHNGGGLQFGPDGMLYIGVGDGGSADDPNRTALDLSSRLGKLLRIDPTPTETDPFTVPADNPFVGVFGADPTIWAIGLRNPWRFSFDSLTGDLWIADVGQNRIEEIDMAPAVDGLDAGKGLNFGWSAFEGNDRFNGDQSPIGHTPPVVTYTHDDGNCSVSGGVVARNSTYPALNGWYLYGDYCSGRIWALDTTSVSAGPDGPIGTPRVVQVATVPGLAAITEGPFGDIYAISNAGPTYRFAPA